MKISRGKLKGRNFFMPEGIRPTQNRVREAVFNILGGDLTGMKFLDLFAGSGAMGLEAVSLGASEVFMVEKDVRNCRVIRENIELLDPPKAGIESQVHVLQMDAFAAIKEFARKGEKFDLIYIDPPYGRGHAKKALKTLGGYDILQPNCAVTIESEVDAALSVKQNSLSLTTTRQYGSKMLSIYALQDA